MTFKFTASLSSLRRLAVLAIALAILAPLSAHAEDALLQQAKKEIAGKNFKNALRTLTQAMNSGSLSDQDMAAALLQRGIAQNGTGHYGAALADLTGALFIGGLSDADTRLAYRERALAYQETGQSQQAQQDTAKAGQSGVIAKAATPKPSSGAADVSALQLPDFKTSIAPAGDDGAAAPAGDNGGKKAAAADKSGGPKVPAFSTSIVNQ